jgi:hypothetical protein
VSCICIQWREREKGSRRNDNCAAVGSFFFTYSTNIIAKYNSKKDKAGGRLGLIQYYLVSAIGEGVVVIVFGNLKGSESPPARWCLSKIISTVVFYFFLVVGWRWRPCYIYLLKKNSGVIFVGIQYLVVFSGVTFTPVLGIQKNIISCVVRA